MKEKSLEGRQPVLAGMVIALLLLLLSPLTTNYSLLRKIP